MVVLLMVLFRVLVLASGIWLAFLGEWSAIAIGVAVLVFAHFALALLATPGALLAFPMAVCARRSDFTDFVLLLALSTFLTLSAMTFWGAAGYFLFNGYVEGKNLVPLLLWSASVAVGPWGAMADPADEEDEPQAFTLLAVFLFQLAYIAVIVTRLVRPVSFWGAVAIIGGVLSIAFFYNLFQARTAFEMLSDEE